MDSRIKKMSGSSCDDLLPIGGERRLKLVSKGSKNGWGSYRRRRKGRRANKTLVLLEEIRWNLMRLTTHLGLPWQRV